MSLKTNDHSHLETIYFSRENILLSGERRSGSSVVDNKLDYQSRDREIDPQLLRSFG